MKHRAELEAEEATRMPSWFLPVGLVVFCLFAAGLLPC